MDVVDDAIRRLREWHRCPACGAAVTAPACTTCGLRLTGEEARMLVQRSEAAARALELRQVALARLKAPDAVAQTARSHDAVPVGPAALPAPGRAAPVSAPPVLATPAVAFPAAPPARRMSLDLNPIAVFSAVGVGAFVAAALVFAFLVPADRGLVRGVLLAAAALSALAMLGLRRRRPVSAAAIAVGTALLCILNVGLAATDFAAPGSYFVAAAGLGGLAVGFGAAGFALRLRPWVSAGVLLAPAAGPLVAAGLLRDDGRAGYWPAASALVAGVALAALGRWAARRWQGDEPGPLPLPLERGVLGLAAAAMLVAGTAMGLLGATTQVAGTQPVGGAILLGLAVAVLLHRQTPTSGWARVAGALAVAAPVVAVLGLDAPGFAATATAGLAWLALAVASGLSRLREGAAAGVLTGGGVAVLGLTVPALVHLAAGAADGLDHVLVRQLGADGPLVREWELGTAGFAAATLLVTAAQSVVASALPAQRFGPLPPAVGNPPLPADPGPGISRLGRQLWPWLALAGLVTLAALPSFTTTISVVLLLVVAAGGWVVARRVDPVTWRPLYGAGRVGGGVTLVAAATASWSSQPLALAAGVVVVALVLGWAQLVRGGLRPVFVALGYGYALVLAGHALTWYPLGWTPGDWTPVAGLLAIAASLVALAVVGRLRPAATVTVLAVGSVPWLLSVLTVIDDRSWWAAGAAASILAVELVVLWASRQPERLRLLAAASLLPTAGVALINLGAMLIAGSASPVLLPVVAALAAAAAVAAGPVSAALPELGRRSSAAARLAIEGGALVTAVVAVVLAGVLPATGAGTSLVVCAILAAGASVLATRPDRRWAWWLAALAMAGVVWSALVLLSVGLVEAYTVPVAVAGLVVGVVLARRTERWWTLAAAGLQLGLVPTVVLVGAGHDVVGRTLALAGAAGALVIVTGLLRRRGAAPPTLLWVLASGLAATAAGIVLFAARSSGRVPPGDPGLAGLLAGLATPEAGFAWVVVASTLAALVLGFAGELAMWASASRPRRVRRIVASWRFAPALAVAALGPVLAVRQSGPIVVAMWLLCLAFLAVTLLSTVLRIRRRTILPPVWFCWLLALGVGIAGWSLRQLRVEFHALPLGLVLLACGVLAWRAAVRQPGARRSWPVGFDDPALAVTPGVLATLGPSTLAIGTDPQTWRAILVLVLALGFLLVGARRLWRATMVAGIVDLAVAIVLVFVARRGSIDAIPWLLALVGAGGVLLGLAIYSERRQQAAPAVP